MTDTPEDDDSDRDVPPKGSMSVDDILTPLKDILVAIPPGDASTARCHAALLKAGYRVSMSTTARALRRIRAEGAIKLAVVNTSAAADQVRRIKKTPEAVFKVHEERVVSALDSLEVLVVDIAGVTSAAMQGLRVTRPQEVAVLAGAAADLTRAITEARMAQHQMQMGIDAAERRDAFGTVVPKRAGESHDESRLVRALKEIKGGLASGE